MFSIHSNLKKRFSQKKKAPANLEKDVYVYFKRKNKLGMCECWCGLSQTRRKEMCLYHAAANGKIFSVCFKHFKFRNSLIVNILIGWAVEYFGDVMFYYFLLADNSGCYNGISTIVCYLMTNSLNTYLSNIYDL